MANRTLNIGWWRHSCGRQLSNAEGYPTSISIRATAVALDIQAGHLPFRPSSCVECEDLESRYQWAQSGDYDD